MYSVNLTFDWTMITDVEAEQQNLTVTETMFKILSTGAVDMAGWFFSAGIPSCIGTVKNVFDRV